ALGRTQRSGGIVGSARWSAIGACPGGGVLRTPRNLVRRISRPLREGAGAPARQRTGRRPRLSRPAHGGENLCTGDRRGRQGALRGGAAARQCCAAAPEPIPLFLFRDAREKFDDPLASALADDGLDEALAALRAFALIDRETIADEREPLRTTEAIRL